MASSFYNIFYDKNLPIIIFKGQIGESYIENTLNCAYINAVITNNAQSPHESDLLFELNKVD